MHLPKLLDLYSLLKTIIEIYNDFDNNEKFGEDIKIAAKKIKEIISHMFDFVHLNHKAVLEDNKKLKEDFNHINYQHEIAIKKHNELKESIKNILKDNNTNKEGENEGKME